MNSVTGDGIYGAKFLVYDQNKNPIGEYTTDDGGYIYIDDLTVQGKGKLFIRELEAAPGYELDKEYKTVYPDPAPRPRQASHPPEILNKPGSLTKEEYEVMKTHTTQGCDLLERVPELWECEAFPAICDVCRHHHERWDGTGYPDRLAGESITPWVHMVGLADAFDALVHPRGYKPAFSRHQAGEMIVTGACGVFDPLLLACFARHIDAICQAVYPSVC